MFRWSPKLSYADVMATVAVVLALGGGAYAATKLPANTVGSKQLRKHAVTPSKVAKSTVRQFKGQKGDKGEPGASGSGFTPIDYADTVFDLRGNADTSAAPPQTLVDQDGLQVHGRCWFQDKGTGWDAGLLVTATNSSGDDGVLDFEGDYRTLASGQTFDWNLSLAGWDHTRGAHGGGDGQIRDWYFRVGPQRVLVHLFGYVERASASSDILGNSSSTCHAFGWAYDGTG